MQRCLCGWTCAQYHLNSKLLLLFPSKACSRNINSCNVFRSILLPRISTHRTFNQLEIGEVGFQTVPMNSTGTFQVVGGVVGHRRRLNPAGVHGAPPPFPHGPRRSSVMRGRCTHGRDSAMGPPWGCITCDAMGCITRSAGYGHLCRSRSSVQTDRLTSAGCRDLPAAGRSSVIRRRCGGFDDAESGCGADNNTEALPRTAVTGRTGYARASPVAASPSLPHHSGGEIHTAVTPASRQLHVTSHQLYRPVKMVQHGRAAIAG